MKKLLVAITAVVLGIAGTTQQAFAHGAHDADAIWIEVILTNLGSNENGMFPIDHPTQPHLPGGSAMQNMTIYLENDTHLQHPHPVGLLTADGGHFFMQSNRNTGGTFDAPICASLTYPFAVDGDGNVTPAVGLWHSDQGGDARNNGCEGQSSLWKIELKGHGTGFAILDGTTPYGDATGIGSAGGADGADGADGAQGPQGKQGDAGTDGAAGAAGAEGADALCVDCTVLSDAVVDFACKMISHAPPSSQAELTASIDTIVDTLTLTTNVCTDKATCIADIKDAIDALK